MRYNLTHRTSYRYADPVDLAHHVLHLTLPQLLTQQVHKQSLSVSAPTSRTHETIDHFGNTLTFVSIEKPHMSFEVALEAEVETRARRLPVPAESQSWKALADQLSGEGFPAPYEASEFCHASPLAICSPEITSYALVSFPENCPILTGALDLMERIYRDFKYQPGSTDISTTSLDVIRLGSGVCQDFAHLAIAGLRGLGLAARYVSGYVRTTQTSFDESSSPRGFVGSDASHAWFSVWCGADHGWIDLDPTNNCAVGDDHITSAYGRDFTDVSPIRGVIVGGRPLNLEVSVQMNAAPKPSN